MYVDAGLDRVIHPNGAARACPEIATVAPVLLLSDSKEPADSLSLSRSARPACFPFRWASPC